MKTGLFVIFILSLIPMIIPNVLAVCSAEHLQWWQACNDTGPNNSLPLNPLLLFAMFGVLFLTGITGIVIRRVNAKTGLLVIASALLLAGILFFVIGINIFSEIQATEERLLSSSEAGRSTPTASYDGMWRYIGTSMIFFVLCGFLLVWRKRKRKQ